MEIKKPCQICERQIAIASCGMCGKLVCRNHYNAYKHICAQCYKKV